MEKIKVRFRLDKEKIIHLLKEKGYKIIKQ
jgi:hypothetical protein